MFVLFLAPSRSFAQSVVDSLENELNKALDNLASNSRLIDKKSERIKQDSLRIIRLQKQIAETETQNKLSDQVNIIEKRDSVLNAARREKILRLKESTEAYPVSVLGDTLFSFYTKLGPIMPKERSANVTEKIEILIMDDLFHPDSLYYTEHESTIDIMYHDLIVTSITDWDALWEVGQKKENLAPIYLERIKESVMNGKSHNFLQNILSRIGLALLIIIIVAIVIHFLNRAAAWGQDWFIRRKETYFGGIRVGTYQLLPPERHILVFRQSVFFIKWGVFALVLYASLPLLFSIFPFTKGWANTLLEWILGPAKEILRAIWDFVPSLFTIVVIYTITRYTVRLLKFISLEIHYEKLKIRGFYPDWAMPSYNIIRFLVYAFMFVVIFPYLPGSDSEIFRGVSVFLGVLFSLGSSSAIANAVAGLVITYMRPFRLGDRVKIGDVTGEVTEKSLLVTRIRTTKNEDITVPNASILTGYTTNYSSSSEEHGLVLHTSVTIGYDVPWRKVHELLINAALRTEGVTVVRDPFVLQTSLDDWYVSYQLNAYTDIPEKMPLIYSELHQNIQDLFNEAEIEIMSPHYRAVRDGNTTTIPTKGSDLDDQ